jgi:hypothetical protein
LTAFSQERAVIAAAGVAVAAGIAAFLVFGYVLVLVHVFVDRRNRNLMISQAGGKHIRRCADRRRACRPSALESVGLRVGEWGERLTSGGCACGSHALVAALVAA